LVVMLPGAAGAPVRLSRRLAMFSAMSRCSKFFESGAAPRLSSAAISRVLSWVNV